MTKNLASVNVSGNAPYKINWLKVVCEYKGASTLSIMTLNITTLSITTLCHHAECCVLFIIKLNVIMLSVIMVSAITLSVLMLSVLMLSIIMLSDVAPIPTHMPIPPNLFRNKIFCNCIFPK